MDSIFVFVKKNRLNKMKSKKHYAKIQNYKYINETKLKNHLHIYVTCMYISCASQIFIRMVMNVHITFSGLTTKI